MVCSELSQSAIEERVVILQSMSLIHNQHRPVDGSKEMLVLQQNLICSEDGVKLEPLVGMTPLILSDLKKELSPSPSPSLSVSPSLCLSRALPSPSHLLSTDDISYIHNQVVPGCPLLKLPVPGWHGGERHDQEEGAIQLVVVREIVKEGNGLNGLPQTHLIG